MPRARTNIAASVKARLLNLSRKYKEDHSLTLVRYASERLLYRLSKSQYRSRFILKGAMLLAVELHELYRPTRDIDLHGTSPATDDQILTMVRDIIRVPVESDGLAFDERSIAIENIQQGDEYQGKRLKLEAHIGQARCYLQIDIGFGDPIVPKVRHVALPSLLDFPPAQLLGYPWENSIAQKLQAMVELDMANSRLKDFFDLWVIKNRLAFEGPVLAMSIRATFDARKTAIPTEEPTALTTTFSEDSDKIAGWNSFVSRVVRSTATPTLGVIVAELSEFLLAPLRGARQPDRFLKSWTKGGPWHLR